MKIKKILLFFVALLFLPSVFAQFESMPLAWIQLKPIIVARAEQTKPKMRLSLEQAESFVLFLNQIKVPTPKLNQLQI